MPDEWETLNGLDPMMPSDGKTKTLDAEKGWYTNLEVYMNSLVEHIVKGGNEAAIEAVDEYYPKYVNADGVQNRLEEVMNPQEIISIDYYSLDGKPLAEPVEGINIRRITYRGGKVYSDLVKKN